MLRPAQNGEDKGSRPALSASALKLRLLKSLKCTVRYEKVAWSGGARLVAGVDEVGRGSLFGCVAAAACILNPADRIRGLRDSKLLTPEVREKLAARIRKRAIGWSVAEVEADRIDEINIYQASLLAMKLAVERLEPRPDYLLVDAVAIDIDCPQKKIIHGDALSPSIAAASILAKVHRDSILRSLDPLYPQYGLARNKGYATPLHRLALQEHGPSPLHRRSFAPVAGAAGLGQLGLRLSGEDVSEEDLCDEELYGEQMAAEEMESTAEMALAAEGVEEKEC